MADSSIEWTEKTWNPVRGCSVLSAGCTNCYAMRTAHRFSGPGGRYEGLTRARKQLGPVWTGEVRFVPEKLAEPLTWRRPQRVFVNSMSDLFHEGVSHSQRAAICGAMLLAPQHTYQALTKRPRGALAFARWLTEAAERRGVSVTALMGCAYFSALGVTMGPAEHERVHRLEKREAFPWWLGVSVEDQATADERLPILVDCPAAVRWVSYEPALAPVDFGAFVDGDWLDVPRQERPPGIDWIVVGGESGPGARPFDLAWARSTIERCRAAGVPCFVKQFGDRCRVTGDESDWPRGAPSARYDEAADEWFYAPVKRKGGDPNDWPEDLRVREYPEVRSA